MSAPAQARGVTGDWRAAGGAIIRIAPCGSDLCAHLIKISSKEPYTVDGQNPDPAKKARPLCNLEIGSGFRSKDPDHAEGGRLYDPRSGKTYHGTMIAEGDELNLRGYVGVKAFGRSEKWTRVKEEIEVCR